MDHIGDAHEAMCTEAADLLMKLIATTSYSKDEEGAAMVIEQYFRTKGVKASRYINNVWVANKHFDPEKPSILLNSHHDTVRPNKDYTRDPFEAEIADGKLYGLGANDAGGCLVALIQVFLHFYEREDLRYNLLLASSAEEEISG